MSAPPWVSCTVVIVKPSEASNIRFLGTTLIMFVIVDMTVRCYLFEVTVVPYLFMASTRD